MKCDNCGLAEAEVEFEAKKKRWSGGVWESLSLLGLPRSAND